MELLKHTFFINLDVRQDRLAHVSNQLHLVGIENPERFPAIQHEKGYIGCTQSHIRCLEMAIEREYEHVFICEDDIHFLNIDIFKNSLFEFYNDDIPWDVLMIAGNNHSPFKVIKNSYMQIFNCQCGTGYIVKKHYYQELLNNLKESLDALQNKAGQQHEFALDMYWCKLQQQNNWFMLTPFTVVQASSYSDIEKRYVDYSWLMLNSE